MLRSTLFPAVIAAAATVAVSAFAGPGAATAPPPAASHSTQAPKLPVTQYQLKNGLTVLLSRDQRLPVVAVDVRYMVGSSYERKGRSGFAHLFEHLMFQGSKHYDHEYFTPFEPIGGEVNGSTTQDRTNFFERVPDNYLDLALWMESDRMEYLLPALDQAKLDNQRDVVKNERRQRYENQPYGMAWIYLGRMLFPPGHPYHHSVIGSHADLTAASLSDVKGFFHEYYAPANAMLTIVGDFEPEQAKALVEKYFGSIPAGKRASLPKVPPAELTKIVQQTHPDDVKLPRVYLAWHSPPLYKKGDAELDLLGSVLSDGKTSRLYQPLVYDKKIAKDVNAYQVSMRLGSFFVVQATAAPGVSVDKLSTELLSTLKLALSKPPSKDEMTRAINGYKKSFYQRLEGVVSRAATLATYYQYTGNANYLDQDLGRYAHATSADVADAAHRYVHLDRYVRLDIVPGSKAGGGK
jgi:zinc protease